MKSIVERDIIKQLFTNCTQYIAIMMQIYLLLVPRWEV